MDDVIAPRCCCQLLSIRFFLAFLSCLNFVLFSIFVLTLEKNIWERICLAVCCLEVVTSIGAFIKKPWILGAAKFFNTFIVFVFTLALLFIPIVTTALTESDLPPASLLYLSSQILKFNETTPQGRYEIRLTVGFGAEFVILSFLLFRIYMHYLMYRVHKHFEALARMLRSNQIDPKSSF